MTDWLTDTAFKLGALNPNIYLEGLKIRRATVLDHCTRTSTWPAAAVALRDNWQAMTPVFHAERPGTHEPGIMFRPADNVAFQAALTANLALLEAAE